MTEKKTILVQNDVQQLDKTNENLGEKKFSAKGFDLFRYDYGQY